MASLSPTSHAAVGTGFFNPPSSRALFACPQSSPAWPVRQPRRLALLLAATVVVAISMLTVLACWPAAPPAQMDTYCQHMTGDMAMPETTTTVSPETVRRGCEDGDEEARTEEGETVSFATLFVAGMLAKYTSRLLSSHQVLWMGAL
mmetsp:Transcript_98407/g.275595  ORF Transcript_98407/g.275595 Transcript_98407/m.275595 type:complete len:147 (-) Transcript_98407:24-464(-)